MSDALFAGGTKRVSRAALLRGTALQGAVVLALAAPALAQPAPGARPQGGTVVAGSASISATASATTIAQSSSRAAIDWRSFDVGSSQTVTFQQPSSSAVTLNRVTGPDPSAIAGHIQANGQVVLTNPSGVVFYKGAQVDAQSVVVSAAGISNQNFMAGRMAFDQAPKPDARIVNNGTITVKQAGLAALVAPSVANSGVITAKLGQVVLAGATTHTLDMYGDGLVSIDVTRQVTQAPRGPDGNPVTALVTNTGVITAAGGVVQLTAAAADGVVQTLVRAGGKIHADTQAGQAGRIEITGTGGSVVVEGQVAARGLAAGETGGQIVLHGSAATSLAAGARVNASGQAGGGTVAVGTTLARAGGSGPAPAGTSATTTIAAGARIAADAKHIGDGGRVTVLSTQQTSVAGRITARGGKAGGNGGLIELSGAQGFALTGTASAAAPKGTPGTILLDPYNLDIVAGAGSITPGTGDPTVAYGAGGGAGTTDTVSAAALNALEGDVHLQAVNDITVRAPITLNPGSLWLEAGNNVTVNAALSSQGYVQLTAGSSAIPGFNPAGALTVAGSVTARGTILLGAGTGGITVSANLTTTNPLSISTTGPLVQTGGSISVADLDGNAASVSLPSRTNAILAVAGDSFTVTGAAGDFLLVDGHGLTVGSASPDGGLSVQQGRTISLTADSLAFAANTPVAAPGGTLILAPFTAGKAMEVIASGAPDPNALSIDFNALLAATTAATVQLGDVVAGVPTAGAIKLGNTEDPMDFGSGGYVTRLVLNARGAVTEGADVGLGVTTLGGQAASVALTSVNNFIATLDGFTTATGDFSLHSSNLLTVAAPLVAAGGHGNIDLSTSASAATTLTLAANVTGAAVTFDTSTGTVSAPGGISQTAGIITAGTLTGTAPFATLPDANHIAHLSNFTATGQLLLTDAQPLQLAGAVSAGELTLVAPGITQAAGSTVTAALLDGSSSAAVTLDNAGNAIAAIGPFTVAAGDLSLATASPTLSFGSGTVTATTGSVQFVADGVRLAARGPVLPAITAPAGSVTFTPLTPNHPIEVVNGSAATAGSLSISQALVDAIQAQTLVLGGAGASGPIALGHAGEAITVSGHAATLNLVTTGAVTQGAGATLATDALTGATGPVTLANPGNAIPALGGYTAQGGFALATAGPLAVGGPVSSTTQVTLSPAGALTVAGGITAPLVDLTAPGITQQAGLIDASGTLTVGTPGAFQQTGGSVTAQALTLNAGSASLPSAANAIGTLAATVTAAPGLTLTDGAGLSVGSLQAAGLPVTLSVLAGGLQVPGTLTAGALTANAAGAFATSGTGQVVADSLSGTAGSIDLAQASIGTLGAVTGTNGVTIANTGPLTIAGPVTDQTGIAVSTQGSLTLAGTVSAPTVALSTTDLPASRAFPLGVPGTILQTGGAVTATGALFVIPSDTLTQTAGALSAGGAATATLTSNGPMTLGGTVTGGTVSLSARDKGAASGTVAQTGGSIQAGVLQGAADSFALAQPANQIGALGTLTAAGTLQVADGETLAVNGPVTAGDTALAVTAGGLAINGPLSVGNLALAVNGDAVASAGSAVTVGGTLSGNAHSLQFGGGVGVTTLGAFTTTAGLTLASTGGLTVNGPVTDSTAIALSSVGPMVLAGNVTAPAIGIATADGQPGSDVLGTISQTGGGLSATGGLTVAASDTVQLAGTISGGAAAVALSSAGPMVLGGVVAGGSVSLRAASKMELPDGAPFTAPGTVTQTGGRITAASLSGSSAAATSLGEPGNAVAALGPYTSAGGFTLVNGGPLTVAGAVQDATGVALSVTGDLNLNANLGTGAVTLAATGGITQNAGAITATTLSGSGGTVRLTGANQVAALGAFTAAGPFSLADAVPLSIAGPVSTAPGQTLTIADDAPVFAPGGSLAAPGGTVALQAATPGGTFTVDGGGLAGTPPVTAHTLTIGSAAGGPVTVTGGLNAAGVAVVDLESASAVTETGTGAIAAPQLTGAVGSAALTGGNQVGVLGPFTASAGGFSLSDGAPLSVTGPVTAAGAVAITGAGTLASSGTISGSSVVLATLDGALTQTAGSIAGTGAVTLNAAGAVTQTGGTLSAGVLSGAATGPVSLGSGGNTVARLDSFSSVGGFALTDAAPISVTGVLADATGVTLATGGTLALSGTISTGALSLSAQGSISQTGGGLAAASLTGAAGAPGVALTSRANRVQSLAGFTSGGDFSLTDGGPLRLAGAVTAAPGGTVALAADNPVFAAGGSLAAPVGNVALSEFTPGIGVTLGGGGLSGNAPIIAGTLSIGTAAGGPVTIAGAFDLSAVPALNLLSAGAIAETGAGALRVGTLQGQGASASLGGANQIGTLGGFTTTGPFALTNGPLTVAGPWSASSASLAVTGDLALSGPVTAPAGLSLAVSGAISQTGGGIDTGALSGRAASAAFGSPANQVATLGNFTVPGDFSLATGRSLTVTGVVEPAAVRLNVQGDLLLQGSLIGDSVSLTATGAITSQPGSLLQASTLNGSARSATLTSGSQVAALGDFTTAGGFALSTNGALAVTGTITDGQSIALASGARMALSGTVRAPAVTLSANGDITQSGGAIGAATLAGSATGAVSLGSAGNAIRTLDGYAAGGPLQVTSTGPFRVNGLVAAPAFEVSADNVTLNGSITAPRVAVNASFGLTLAGTIHADAVTLLLQPGPDGHSFLFQTGAAEITPISAAAADVRITLPASGGSATFDGLDAPAANLTLSLGSGSALGAVTLGGLFVEGSGGFAQLTGQVGGFASFAAAQHSDIAPAVSQLYQLNGCAIGAAACSTALPDQAFLLPRSVLRPDLLNLQVLDLSLTRDEEDATLLLPNISDRDY